MSILLCLVAFITFTAIWLKYIFSYWKRNGFPEVKPQIPFGCMLPFVRQQKSALMTMAGMYHQSTARYVGIYVFFVPQLMIRDPELIRRVMINDADCFIDRDTYINEENDPLSVHMFSQKGQKWKHLRQRLTPLFTSGKLKNMFSTLALELNKFDRHLECNAKVEGVIELRETITSYILNVIASIFFGLDVDTIENPKHIFKEIFEAISKPKNTKEVLRQASSFFFPQLLKLFNAHSLSAEVREYFMALVSETISHRERESVRRNDMLQLMIDLKNQDKEVTIEEIAGNSFIFFFASVETSTGAALYCLYELSRHPLLFRKAQLDVDQTLAKHDGQINYDSVHETKYIDLCVNETLRLYPSFAVQSRLSVKDYRIPDSDLTVKSGTSILLPLGPIYRNESHFPHPTEFMPERFENGMADESIFFPFGAGPRQCIAFRLGRMLAKTVIVQILSKYNLELLTMDDITFDPNTLPALPKEGITVKISMKG